MRGFLFIQVFIVKYTYMGNILNEINRSRKLMGLNESEVNEQGFIKSALDGLKKGLNQNSETSTNTEDDLGDYNGKPIVEILNEIDETKSNYGTIDVNGETLHFGVGVSVRQNVSDSIADSNARKSFGPEVLKNTATVIKEMFFENNEYKTYILMKTL